MRGYLDRRKDFQFEGDEGKRFFKQQLLSHTMYQSDIRVRETIEYSAMELNLDPVTNQGTEFNPKKLAQIRTNFDAVAEGRYEKKLEPKVMKYVETQADAAYRKETGSKEADRNSPLWKTMRNVELLKYDRTLWNTVQEPTAGTDVSKTMTDQSNNPDLGSNALNRPGQSPTLKQDLLQPETFPSGTGQQKQNPGGFDTTVNPRLAKPLEGFPVQQKVDGVTTVFDYTTDHRKNYEQVNGPIPAGSQVHHLAPRAVFNRSDLAQEWVRRGITKLDYPENLEALPQTKDAYDKSSVKIQHSGSHGKWSGHAEDVLAEEQKRLIKRYGSLDKVPDDVMEQTKDDVLEQLREDLMDKDLGLEKGWVVPKDSGMDKLSQVQPTDQIG
jgi:A nuclease family of the HNH/ENDO VII superfamily with conserved AHH